MYLPREMICTGNESLRQDNTTLESFETYYMIVIIPQIVIYLVSSFRILLVIVGVIGNSFLIGSIISEKKFKMTPYDVFVGSIASGNVMVLLTEALIVVEDSMYIYSRIGDGLCRFCRYIVHCATFIVMTFQILLSIDRLMKINFSFSKRGLLMTTRCAQITATITWIVLLSLFALEAFKSTNINVSYGICTISLCYNIYYHAPGFHITMATLELYVPCAVLWVINCLVLKSFLKLSRRRRRSFSGTFTANMRLKDLRGLKLILASGVILLFCWFAFIVVHILTVIIKIHVPVWIKVLRNIIRVCYAVVLPYLYGQNYRLFRHICNCS